MTPYEYPKVVLEQLADWAQILAAPLGIQLGQHEEIMQFIHNLTQIRSVAET